MDCRRTVFRLSKFTTAQDWNQPVCASNLVQTVVRYTTSPNIQMRNTIVHNGKLETTDDVEFLMDASIFKNLQIWCCLPTLIFFYSAEKLPIVLMRVL
jgi:hypothetical protein